MDADRALEVISALADGVNPLSGEPVSIGEVVQQPDVVRALTEAKGALLFAQQRRLRQARAPANGGKPWTAEEDEQLIAAHQQDGSLAELARAHRRSAAAIQLRLLKLRVLD